MTRTELRLFLEEQTERFNHPDFIQDDPIQLPHRFSRKEDIEITALLVSTIAWGKRELIIRSGERMLDIMGHEPYEFVRNYSANNLPRFVHRTFNAEDLDFFFRSLQQIYAQGGLERTFSLHPEIPGVKGRIVRFRDAFLQTEHLARSEKHLSNPSSNSAAKRLNMFLRWMVRNDRRGVDFGIWRDIPSSELCIPLDVHTATISRKLGLLKRRQNDWKALEEIMQTLREFDPDDPAKYDFALFGTGVTSRPE